MNQSFILFFSSLAMVGSAQAVTQSKLVEDFVKGIYDQHSLIDGNTYFSDYNTEVQTLQAGIAAYLQKHPNLDPSACHLNQSADNTKDFSGSVQEVGTQVKTFAQNFNQLSDSANGKFAINLSENKKVTKGDSGKQEENVNVTGFEGFKRGLKAEFEKDMAAGYPDVKVIFQKDILEISSSAAHNVTREEIDRFLFQDLGLKETQREYSTDAKETGFFLGKHTHDSETLRLTYQFAVISCDEKPKTITIHVTRTITDDDDAATPASNTEKAAKKPAKK